MAHGGARPGAGRKAGAATQKTREIADKAASEGITPLEFMLKILRDETRGDAERFEAAKQAAPFVHPKLSAVQADVDLHGEVFTEIRRTVVDPRHTDA